MRKGARSQHMGYVAVVTLVVVVGLALRLWGAYALRAGGDERPGEFPSASLAARKMLDRAGAGQVSVRLSRQDRVASYDMDARTIRLPEGVYHGRNIAAIAVACHECGHAEQQLEGNVMLCARASATPVFSAVSQAWLPVLLVGLVLDVAALRVAALVLLSLVLLFQFAVVPVELDASRRAVRFIESGGIGEGVSGAPLVQARSILRSLALTYLSMAMLGVVDLPLRLAARYVSWS